MEIKRKFAQNSLRSKQSNLKSHQTNLNISKIERLYIRKDTSDDRFNLKIIQKKTQETKINNDELGFIPKNLIICLVLRKVFLTKLLKLTNFAFSLIRSLYKEIQIKSTPRKKLNARSSSYSIQSNWKENIFKKSKENSILNVYLKNKSKLITNRLFFIWIQKYRKRTSSRFSGASKICECFNRKVGSIFSNFIRRISKFQLCLANCKSLFRTIEQVIKKKLFNCLFKPQIKTLSVKFISFQPFSPPMSSLPVFISKHKIYSRSCQMHSIKSKPSDLEKVKRGLVILNSFKGFRRLLLKQSLRDIRDLSRALKINDKLKSAIKINSLVLKMTKDKLQYAYKTFKSNFKSLQELKVTLLKLGKVIQRLEVKQKQRSKIFAFSMIQKHYSDSKSKLMIQLGFQKVSNSLRVKILNRLYYGFLAVQSYQSIFRTYQVQIRNYPWVLRALSQIINSKRKANKIWGYQKIRTFVYNQNLFKFTLLIDLHLKKQDLKSKRSTFILLTTLNQSRYRCRRLNLNYLKFSSLVKKLYLKKIASCFLNWENKSSLLKIWSRSTSAYSKKIHSRRFNSCSSTTCESRRLSSNQDRFTVLPRPTNDFVDITKEKFNISYF